MDVYKSSNHGYGGKRHNECIIGKIRFSLLRVVYRVEQYNILIRRLRVLPTFRYL